MDSFRKNIEVSEAQLSEVSSKLTNLSANIASYEHELSVFTEELRKTYDYDSLVKSSAELQRQSDSLVFDIRVNKFRMLVEGILRLVRADPDNAEVAVKKLCDETDVSISWNSHVKAETYAACFSYYAKQIFDDVFWMKFSPDGDESWYVSQVSDYNWRPCIAIDVPLGFLDSGLDSFLRDVGARTRDAAENWSRRFLSDYMQDDDKLRAIYAAMKSRFEKD